MSKKTKVNSLAEMHQLGMRIGKNLKAGDLVLLSGPLGAGKTALTQGIGLALGIENITSPTFVISRIHPGKIPLVHVDAYRLQGDSTAIFDDLDLESYLPTSITVVEWGEGLADRLADQFLEIQIEFGESDDQRLVSIVGHGQRFSGFEL